MFSGLNSQGGGPLASSNSIGGGGGSSIPGLSKFQELVYSTIQVCYLSHLFNYMMCVVIKIFIIIFLRLVWLKQVWRRVKFILL